MTLARLVAPTLAAPFLVAAGFAAPALAQPTAFGGPKMLIHGNYCGPGNNAPLPPIDALDAACARHDACTPSGELASPACNLRLQREAELIARDPRQPDDVRSLAGFIAVGAAIIPSSPRAAPTALPALAPQPHGFAAPVPADEDDDAE